MKHSAIKTEVVTRSRGDRSLAIECQEVIDRYIADGWEMISSSSFTHGESGYYQCTQMMFGKPSGADEIGEVQSRLDQILAERDELLNRIDEQDRKIAELSTAPPPVIMEDTWDDDFF